MFKSEKQMSSYFSEVQCFVRIVEGGELSGAAVQVDKTRAERWQETKTVIHCNDTKWPMDFIINRAEHGMIKMKKGLID